MLKINYSSRFKKDYKTVKKRGCDITIFEEVVGLLREGKPLPEKYYDHALVGNYKNHRECHLTPDWLLIYKIEKEILTLTMTRTGTHSDLYRK